MKFCIDIPDYKGKGLSLVWEENFILKARIGTKNENAIISGNSEGLISLARHLLLLAQPNVSAGHHYHFDDLNSLEQGSCELIIEKIN